MDSAVEVRLIFVYSPRMHSGSTSSYSLFAFELITTGVVVLPITLMLKTIKQHINNIIISDRIVLKPFNGNGH